MEMRIFLEVSSFPGVICPPWCGRNRWLGLIRQCQPATAHSLRIHSALHAPPPLQLTVKFLKPGDTFLCLPWALQKLYLVSAQDTLYIMFASFPAILPPLPMNPDTLLMITHSYILLGNNFSVSMHILFHLQSKPLKGRLFLLPTYSLLQW